MICRGVASYVSTAVDNFTLTAESFPARMASKYNR